MSKYREILKIAIPAIFESLATVIILAIDTQMISVLGNDAISAVSFTTQPKLIFIVIFFALGTATSMFVSQAYGRKDKEEANRYFILILKISLILSAILGIILYVFADVVMCICSRQKTTLELSVVFYRIIMGGMIFQTTSIVINAALRGIGKTKITLFSNIALGITDIIFNYLLIEGHCGFPKLGVAGDAIATVMGTVAACVVGIWALLSNSEFLSLKDFFNIHFNESKEYLRCVYYKAGSIVAENTLMRISFLLNSIIISLMSSSETAVYSVGMIVLNYSFAFGDGLQSAVLALTGKSTGENNIKNVKEYTTIGIRIGVIFSVVLALIYIVFSYRFFELYFEDEASKNAGVIVSNIIAIITLFQIIRIICIASIRGMGEVKAPKRISIIVTLLNPILSYLLAIIFNFKIWGIWASMTTTHIVWAILIIMLYRKLINELYIIDSRR